MKKKDMHVGFGTQQELLSILKKDCATHKDVNKFRIDAREFLVTLLEKMFDKNPISFNIVKYASILDPNVLFSQPGIVLETEGSVRKIQNGHFFTTKKLKRAPLI